MLELPELVTLARQAETALPGATVVSCDQGNSPHKWAWYSAEPAEYERIAVGKTVGGAKGVGNRVAVRLDPGYWLAVGDMGGKLLLHADETTVPKKRHLTVGFDDGRFLTAAIQGWGGMWLLTDEQLARYADAIPPSPISDEFTYERFRELVAEDTQQGKRSVKAFMASRPRISGVGNGYVQDICFRARLHPRRDLSTLTARECRKWHRAIRQVLTEAIERGGRDTETDLYGEPGGYVPILDRRANGRPCPECGTPIEKIAYLGGSCYFCPQCQAQGG
jgi:formamidopyrimidine-DNA glycosylase